jgi:hypothetical protein
MSEGVDLAAFVAQADQKHAAALAALREANLFLLVTDGNTAYLVDRAPTGDPPTDVRRVVTFYLTAAAALEFLAQRLLGHEAHES